MNHFYFDPAWLKKREYPAHWGEIFICVLAVIFMIAVTIFFFSWLGNWAWLFMWPWLIIISILAELL